MPLMELGGKLEGDSASKLEGDFGSGSKLEGSLAVNLKVPSSWALDVTHQWQWQ